MKKLKFSIDISKPPSQVWKVLWDDKSYREWTKVFSEGSYAVSDWKEGSKIQFLSSNGEGMYSIIDKQKPNEMMSFTHMGMVKNFEEQPLDEETKQWSGSKEQYFLSESNGGTKLNVELDTTDSFEEYFSKTFPKAMEKVKELAEKK